MLYGHAIKVDFQANTLSFNLKDYKCKSLIKMLS